MAASQLAVSLLANLLGICQNLLSLDFFPFIFSTVTNEFLRVCVCVCVCVCVFCLLRATPEAYGGSQSRGRMGAAACTAAASLHHSHSKLGSKPHLQPTPQLTAMPDPLTHWARPGIKSVSSWILVRFITAESQQELLFFSINHFEVYSSWCFRYSQCHAITSSL